MKLIDRTEALKLISNEVEKLYRNEETIVVGERVEEIGLAKAFDIIYRLPFIEERPKGRWIPCSEKLPETDGYYLTTTMYKEVYCDYWSGVNFDRTEMVVAWMELPQPYRGDEK